VNGTPEGGWNGKYYVVCTLSQLKVIKITYF
jgi:hypothetical protein